MKNKILSLTLSFMFILLISLTSVSAYYPYLYDYGAHTRYHYYEDDIKYPIIIGPYPRYYLFHKDFDKEITYLHDDFGGFDEFIGYKDLDIFNPDGTIDIIRYPNAGSLDLSDLDLPEGTKTFGNHVYGYIPGPDGSYVMYRKHYHHEHPWEVEEYEYGYGYGYAHSYYTPFLAYRDTPVYPSRCQSISACETRYCGSCNW